MAGWETLVHFADFDWAHGLLCSLRAVLVNAGRCTTRDEFAQVAAIHVHLHDSVGLPRRLGSSVDRKQTSALTNC